MPHSYTVIHATRHRSCLSWNKSSFIAAADIQVYSSEKKKKKKKKVIGVIEEYSPSNQQLDETY